MLQRLRTIFKAGNRYWQGRPQDAITPPNPPQKKNKNNAQKWQQSRPSMGAITNNIPYKRLKFVGCPPPNWILFHGYCWLIWRELPFPSSFLLFFPICGSGNHQEKCRCSWYFMAFATLKVCQAVFLLSHHLRIWSCTARTIRAVAAWQSKAGLVG